MKLLDLYTDYIANWISEGLLISRDRISLLGIKPLFDRYITNSWITKVWMVVQMPVHYDVNITQAIRSEMTKLYPNVRTVVHMYNSPLNVNVQSDTFLRLLRNAAASYNRYEQVFESLSEDQQLTGFRAWTGGGHRLSIDKETLLRIKDQYDSYMYVYEQATTGKSFTNTYYFIQASAKSRKELRQYKKSLTDLLSEGEPGRFSRYSSIILRELYGSMGVYLDNFCPAATLDTKNGKFSTMLLSQSNKAALLPSKVKGNCHVF